MNRPAPLGTIFPTHEELLRGAREGAIWQKKHDAAARRAFAGIEPVCIGMELRFYTDANHYGILSVSGKKLFFRIDENGVHWAIY